MKTSLLLFGLALAVQPMVSAGVILTLTPAGGAVSALPGGVTGWGFTFSNDVGYAVVDNAELIPAGSLGTFSDFISLPSNFNVIGPDGPFAQTSWAEGFNETLQTGLGDFHVDPAALPGSSVSGEIRLFYDLFSRSPFDPKFDPDVDMVSTGNFTDAAVSIQVNAPANAPEPASCLLMGSGFVVGSMLCRRRRRRAR